MMFVRSLRTRVGLAFVATALALCVVEVGLRLIGGVFEDTFVRPDADRGWSLRPGFAGWVRQENVLWLRINGDGLRDREHPLAVPPRTVRIAILGDSYMQGMNVPIEQTFASRLEQNLTTCLQPTGRQAETLNFGVFGYGTAQELLAFRHHAAKYKPAVVLLAIYTNNDVFNNIRPLNPSTSPERSPYFVLDGDRLVLDNSFREVLAADPVHPWWRRLRIVATDHSRVAQLVHLGWTTLRPQRPRDEREAEAEALEAQLYKPPVTPEMRAAWRVTEALLLALNQEVEASGADLWMVTLSNARQVHPSLAARRAQQERMGVESLFYPDLRLRDFGAAHGIPVVTLAPALADYAAANRVFLNGGYTTRAPFGAGHWNEVGNRVAAELAGARLCARIAQ